MDSCKDKRQDLRELVTELSESVHERDGIIKLLTARIKEDREAIQDLAEGLNSLAQNQVVFADNFRKIGYMQQANGQPALPAARPAEDFDGWN